MISCRYKTRVYFAWASRELKNDQGFSDRCYSIFARKCPFRNRDLPMTQRGPAQEAGVLHEDWSLETLGRECHSTELCIIYYVYMFRV